MSDGHTFCKNHAETKKAPWKYLKMSIFQKVTIIEKFISVEGSEMRGRIAL
jgi:hypothetical protein